MEDPQERKFALGKKKILPLTRLPCDMYYSQLTTWTPTHYWGSEISKTLQIRLFSNAGGTDHPLVSGLRLFKTRFRGMNGSLHLQSFLKVHVCKLDKYRSLPSITQADLHPSVNPVAGEPSSAQSTSGDVSLTEPNQVTQPPDHLRRWTKIHS
ncbi:hypothetical protein Tco_0453762 [Tanacetum coccineum]